MKNNCEWSLQDIFDSFISDWSPEELAVCGINGKVESVVGVQL